MQTARDVIEPFEVDVGAIVAGRYRLERLLGRGGMGEVWVARHSTLDTPYAIKFLDRTLLADLDRETILVRFLDEAKASSSLSKQSRHIVSVHDYGEQGGTPYIVMEMLDGMSLDQRIESGPMPPEEALAVLQQVARAVTHAHKAKLIHRDLKPGNVFLCRDEEGQLLVKVLDFGLVRSIQQGDKHVTQKGIAVGTPSYMSPEQARASAAIDHRCDVWSMAVLSYAMLVGKTPWPGETMQEVLVNVCRSEYIPLSVAKEELGTQFDAFYEKAFRRQAKDRHNDAEELVEAFRKAVAGGVPAAEVAVVVASDPAVVPLAPPAPLPTATPLDVTPSARPGITGPKQRGRMAAIAALVLVLVALGTLLVVRGGPDPAGAATSSAKPPPPPATALTEPPPTPADPKPVPSVDSPKAPSAAHAPKVPAAPASPKASAAPPPVIAPEAPAPKPVPAPPPSPPAASTKPHDKSEVL